MLAWLEGAAIAAVGAGVGTVAGLFAQATSGESSTPFAWGGAVSAATFVGYLTAFLIPDLKKERKELIDQNKELAAANRELAKTNKESLDAFSALLQRRMEARDAQLNAVIDLKDKERASSLKEAHDKFDKALQTLTNALTTQHKEELALVRELYEKHLHPARPTKGNP